MYGLSAIRARVNALRRKMARELAVLRLSRMAHEFNLQWTIAVGERQPIPETHPFVKKVVAAGFRLPTFGALHRCLNRHRSRNTIPEFREMVRALLPWSWPILAAHDFNFY